MAVSSIKLKEVGITGGSILSGVNFLKLKQKGLQFTFIFDLNNKDAVGAYGKMISGNVLHSQKLFKDNKKGILAQDKMKLAKKAKSLTKGRIFKGALRIPFLFTFGFNVENHLLKVKLIFTIQTLL